MKTKLLLTSLVMLLFVQISYAELNPACTSAPSRPGSITVTNGGVPVCPQEYRTYTVAPVAGALYYIWTIPAGSDTLGGNGGGSNSILVSYGAYFTGGTISVRASNDCGTSDVRTLTIPYNFPQKPGSIAGPTKVCPGDVGRYSFTKVEGILAYHWTLFPGCVFSGNGPDYQDFRFTTDFTASSGTLSLTAENGCGISDARTLTIDKNYPATPGSISGVTKVCPGDVINYSVPNVSGMSYYWSIFSGAQILTYNNYKITMGYNTGFTASSGTLKVTATNGCGTSAARTLTINKNYPATPGSITGVAKVCPGDQIDYSVSSVSGITYAWGLFTGAQAITTNNNKITIGYNSNFNGGTLKVYGANACGTSAARSLAISEATPATPGSITPNISGAVCSGNVRSYTVSPVTGLTYDWLIPYGASSYTLSASPYNKVTITWGSNVQPSSTVQVRAKNACSNYSDYKSLTVLSGAPDKPNSISGSSTLCRNVSQTYSIPLVSGATSYNWSVDNIYSITGQGSNVIQLISGPFAGSGTLSVYAANACGKSLTRSLSLNLTTCREAGEPLVEAQENNSLVVYPNPVNDFVHYEIHLLPNNGTLRIFDCTGRQLVSQPVSIDKSGELINDLDVSLFSTGIYLMKVELESGEVVQQKFTKL